MAPSWVLLSRNVYIEHEVSRTRGESSIGGTVGGVPSRKDIADAILAYLRTLKPEARFANPLELSSLRLLRPTESIPPHCGDITSAYIASTDKNLVALYAGPYRPGTDRKGGYLVYDAGKNSLSTIPPPPYDCSRANLGLGAVVVCPEDEEDTYLLVELTELRGSNPPEAALCMWRSSSAEWIVHVGSFPPELCYAFKADMCFSYQGSILCWVDLFKGMVICDLTLQIGGHGPELRFIPLPAECMVYGYDRFERPLQPEEFRSIACVGGDSIKFVTMDGYGQRPVNELCLTIWTLSTDLSTSWKKVREYHVRDIWASAAYRLLGLKNILPSFPVLSMHEDDVVCLVVTHWNVAVDGEVEYRGQYLLSVDMRHNRVSQRPTDTEQLHSQLFATKCSAYYSA